MFLLNSLTILSEEAKNAYLVLCQNRVVRDWMGFEREGGSDKENVRVYEY